MSTSLPMLTGKPIPQVGLGTWQSVGGVGEAVKAALEAGYKHIDTAIAYGNEAEIGDALKAVYKAGKITRGDIYITTKLSGATMVPERVLEQTELSLKKLQTDYVDLLLIHFPVCPSDEGLDKSPPSFFPSYKKGVIKTLFVDPLDTWREMEKLVDAGKVKAIGLSNFNKEQVQRIWNEARIKPANLQCECHAWFAQNELVDFCKSKGITFTAYAPIGSPGRSTGVGPASDRLMDDPVVTSLAQKYKKTPAQVLLRNLLQRGIVILPKSTQPARIVENIQIFDFKLSDADMDALRKINKNQRLFKFTFLGVPNALHPFFPWKEDLLGDYKPGTHAL